MRQQFVACPKPGSNTAQGTTQLYNRTGLINLSFYHGVLPNLADIDDDGINGFRSSPGMKLPPIAYFLLIAHLIFFSIVGGYALYVSHH